MTLRAASSVAFTFLMIACSSESTGTSSGALKTFGDCCTSHSECATGYCSPTERQCTQTCSTDSECPIEEKDGKADCSSSRKECNADRVGVKCSSDDDPTPTNTTDAGTTTKTDAGKDSGTTTTGGALGLGEPCTDNAQCKSTTCYRPGGTTGFCTKSCTESVQCLGAYGSGKNSLNEYLWCMPFAGGGRCYPGCINTTTACSKFSGLTCRSTKDIKGGAAKVCSEL